MFVSRRDDVDAFTTLDGSTIREVVGPAWTPAENQSLAEATIPAGTGTIAHVHHRSEELYLLRAGEATMWLGEERRRVRAGDCVVIPPGVPHRIAADEARDVVLWCCCAPAYSDADTELLEERSGRGPLPASGAAASRADGPAPGT